MKATITVGISGSGKTSCAKTQKATIICRDDVRAQILTERGHDVVNSSMWTFWKFNKSDETEVTARCSAMVEECAKAEQDIIIADTNLNADRRVELAKKLENIGYTVEYKQFDISYEEACKRDKGRKDTVGEGVIYKQWLQLYGEPYKAPEGAPTCVIVDIDGTLAHMDGKRGTFEWDKVGQDSCDQVVKRIVDEFSSDNEIIVMSGRDGICYDLTKQWLDDHDIYYDRLVMRKAGDMRKDYIVKRELFDEHIRGKYAVTVVVDDRKQVIREWHRIGLKVIAVGDQNIEF